MAVKFRDALIHPRLMPFIERIPTDTLAALDTVTAVARALRAENYEKQATQARRSRDSLLAKGYSALADDALTGAPDTEDTRSEIANLRKQAAVTTGVVRQGYYQRIADLTLSAPPEEFMAQARQMVGESATPTGTTSVGLVSKREKTYPMTAVRDAIQSLTSTSTGRHPR